VSNFGDGIGLIAYPWLASALTRNPILIAGVMVAQRLPWLLFSLPAGVVADRFNRRSLMVGANAARAALTTVVAAAILIRDDSLASPDELDALLADGGTIPTQAGLYTMLVAATFLLGLGEVVHDTAALTVLPQLVDDDLLERANGRLVSGEQVMNQFLGPPIGALLLAFAFAVPFFVDAATFALSAIMLTTIASAPPPTSSADIDDASRPGMTSQFISDLKVGYRALRDHEYLRLFAIVATVLNLTAGMVFAMIVFYAQEVLGTSPAEFSALTIGSAAGSVLGGMAAAALATRFGSGTVLRVAAVTIGFALLAMAVADRWTVVAVLLGIYAFATVIWMVLTVSLRQAVTANDVLGRVNGVYRFFSFGAIPIGALLAGVAVAVVELGQGREFALRMPFVIAGVLALALFVYAGPKLSNERVEQARRAGPEGVESPECA